MQNHFIPAAAKPAPLDLGKTLGMLNPEDLKRLSEGYDCRALAKVFSNDGLMAAAKAFLENGMNVSLTARSLYMHRNTLIYKLNAVKRLTGFDLKDFGMAVTFKILYTIYMRGLL